MFDICPCPMVNSFWPLEDYKRHLAKVDRPRPTDIYSDRTRQYMRYSFLKYPQYLDKNILKQIIWYFLSKKLLLHVKIFSNHRHPCLVYIQFVWYHVEQHYPKVEYFQFKHEKIYNSKCLTYRKNRFISLSHNIV